MFQNGEAAPAVPSVWTTLTGCVGGWGRAGAAQEVTDGIEKVSPSWKHIKGSIVLSDASAHDSERDLFRAGTILMSQ